MMNARTKYSLMNHARNGARLLNTQTHRFSLIISLLAFTFALSPSALSAQQATPAPAPDYTAHANEVVNDLAARHFDKVFAQFDTNMAAAVPLEKLGTGWDQLVGQAGAFQKIDSSKETENSGYHIVAVTCIFEKARINIILAFDDAAHIVGMHIAPLQAAAPPPAPWNPPPYADSTKFREETVTVSDGQWQMPGTLSIPNGKGPFTAVVLISGSGPNDADETIGPNKPFRDIAWGLATNGIAVLRYSKRTLQYGNKSFLDPQNFTVKEEYLDDARAAVALLTTRPEINPKRIFLAGHSEGGYLAPRIAAADPQIAGIIIVEGETRPIEQLVIDQLQYQAKLGGPNAAQIEAAIPQVQAQAKIIEDPNLKPGTDVKLLTATIPSSYFLDLRTYDPVAVAASLRVPIYITQGGRDYQVTTADFANWQKALAGHSNATLKLYPDLNHLLISGTGPSKPDEYFVAGQHVSPEVVTDLSAWINAH
jgi:uncharacterized protein